MLARAIKFRNASGSPNPPEVSESLIREVETLLGVRLPASYVELMKQHNGGYIDTHRIKVIGEIPKNLVYYTEDGSVGVHSISGISTAKGPASLGSTPYLVKEWDLPAGLVLLDGDGHVWIALDYREVRDDPPVVFVVSDEAPVLPLARNFAEFISKLVREP